MECGPAAPEHADELTCVNTLTKADLTGTFMHACVNKCKAEYSMMVKAVRRCSRTLLGGGGTHSGGQVRVPARDTRLQPEGGDERV